MVNQKSYMDVEWKEYNVKNSHLVVQYCGWQVCLIAFFVSFPALLHCSTALLSKESNNYRKKRLRALLYAIWISSQGFAYDVCNYQSVHVCA